MSFGNTVTLRNRTKRDLKVKFDGNDHILRPGDNPGVPVIVVEYARNQNPLMGSEHPYDPTQFECLLGVVDNDALAREFGMELLTPIDNDPKATQRINRKKVVGRYTAKNVVDVDAGGITAFDARQSIGGNSSTAEFGGNA